jgi:transcriptional regulator with XRE-family HTH domain
VPQPQINLTSPCFPPQTPEGSFLNSDRTRISNAERTERDAGRRRREAREAIDWHEQALRSLLHHKTDDKARLGLQSLLITLTAGYGLGWSDIARLVGVSVPAVRKWRHGGDITSARLQNVARLVAFLDMLEEEEIRDPAAWLDLPLDDLADEIPPISSTKKQIYINGGVIDLLEYAKRHISSEELLSRASVRTRHNTASNRIIKAPDGVLSIVSGR